MTKTVMSVFPDFVIFYVLSVIDQLITLEKREREDMGSIPGGNIPKSLKWY